MDTLFLTLAFRVYAHNLLVVGYCSGKFLVFATALLQLSTSLVGDMDSFRILDDCLNSSHLRKSATLPVQSSLLGKVRGL